MRPMVNHDRVESERAEVVDHIRHVQFYNYSQSRCRVLTKIVFSWVICDDDQKVEVSAYNSAT